mgnify:CR=1 FL=1
MNPATHLYKTSVLAIRTAALAGWNLLQNGPRLPLLRGIQVGAENVLGLFHASL